MVDEDGGEVPVGVVRYTGGGDALEELCSWELGSELSEVLIDQGTQRNAEYVLWSSEMSQRMSQSAIYHQYDNNYTLILRPLPACQCRYISCTQKALSRWEYILYSVQSWDKATSAK